MPRHQCCSTTVDTCLGQYVGLNQSDSWAPYNFVEKELRAKLLHKPQDNLKMRDNLILKTAIVTVLTIIKLGDFDLT